MATTQSSPSDEFTRWFREEFGVTFAQAERFHGACECCYDKGDVFVVEFPGGTSNYCVPCLRQVHECHEGEVQVFKRAIHDAFAGDLPIGAIVLRRAMQGLDRFAEAFLEEENEFCREHQIKTAA